MTDKEIKILSVRMPQERMRALKTEAARLGTTNVAVVNSLVEKWLVLSGRSNIAAIEVRRATNAERKVSNGKRN